MRADKWAVTDDVLTMLWSRGKKLSERRLRLFMLTCAERETPPPQIRSFTAAVNAIRTLLFEGSGAAGEVEAAVKLAQEEAARWVGQHPLHQWALAALRLADGPFHLGQAWHVVLFLRQATSPTELHYEVARHSPPHADLAREIFGPFRMSRFLIRWRTETVRLLADGIHADRAYDRLPILADALEEAGCGSLELLNHCRGPGPHRFGCWALDLVRGCY